MNDNATFEVTCISKADRNRISLALMRIAVMLSDEDLHCLSGGIAIIPVSGGFKLSSDIILLEGKLNG
jgi:hypothetical protein